MKFLYTVNLKELNLASNNLIFLNKRCFYGLTCLKKLKLCCNKINSTDFLKSNKNYLKNLEILDLEQNEIILLNDTQFTSFVNLSFLNLNSNPIESIHVSAFNGLKLLKTLRLSKSKIDSLNLNSDLKELDLSFMNVSIFVEQKLSYIEWINLAKVNCSFELFLSNVSKYVDFSYNQFKWENDSKIFNILGPALEVLKLRQTNLCLIQTYKSCSKASHS